MKQPKFIFTSVVLSAAGFAMAAGSLWNMDVDAYEVQVPSVGCDLVGTGPDAYCRKCGRYLGEMDHYWAERYGEIAPRRVITRFFEYHRDNGLINEHFLENHNYPGNAV